MTFTVEALHDILESLSIDISKPFWVAYSGGLDSHVLLHALSLLRKAQPVCNIKAIHINHSISPNAHAWAQHCLKVCKDLEVECILKIVDVPAAISKDLSMEELARNLRYQAFKEVLGEEGYLFVAHHQDDQAETFLLQALRGAGLKGLSSMPYLKSFASGELIRPLLGVSRQALLQYAQNQKLSWIEDESNVSPQFDRNYVRHHVLPGLVERFPATQTVLSRSAQHCAEASKLLDELAQEDLQRLSGVVEDFILSPTVIASRELVHGTKQSSKTACHPRESGDPEKILLDSRLRGNDKIPGLPRRKRATTGGCPYIRNDDSKRGVSQLPIAQLLMLSPARQKNLLRFWIQQNGFLLPSQVKLEQLQKDVLLAKPDASPCVTWEGVELRRYQDQLYLMSPMAFFDAHLTFRWDIREKLVLPGFGVLRMEEVEVEGDGLLLPDDAELTIKFRQGGERMHPAGAASSRTLKNLFQEWGVPPWLRNRIPLLYHGDTLVMVVGYVLSEHYLARGNGRGKVVLLE